MLFSAEHLPASLFFRRARRIVLGVGLACTLNISTNYVHVC